jgi:sugar transferase (PEP-CTERM system associated)
MLEVISKRKLKLCLGDFILITALQVLAFLIVVEKKYFLNYFQRHFWIFLLVPLIWTFILFVSRAYEVIEEGREKISDTNIFIKAAIISIITLGFIFYLLLPFVDFPQRVLLIHGFLVIVVLWLWRVIFAKLIHHPRRVKKVLILGTSWPAQEIAWEIVRQPNKGYSLTGFIENREEERATTFSSKFKKGGYEIDKKFILGEEKDIPQVVKNYRIDLIISALAERKSQKVIEALLEVQEGGVSVIEMPEFYEELTGKVPIEYLGSSWAILGRFSRNDEIKESLEYVLNAFFAFWFLIFSLPLSLMIALFVKMEDKGPIFYCQKRVGKDGRIFTSIKFRTMRPEAEKETGPVWTKEDDERMTRIGRFLRKWRLDEIPQLINILRGEMVFVGPRPERPEFVVYLEQEIPFYKMRHLIKPGLTGWAQVRFKYGASVQDALQKLQYELYYIKHRSLLFDLIIILKTIEVIITGRGAQ